MGCKSRSKTRMRACEGSRSPTCRRRITEVAVSARSLSHRRRRRDEGARNRALNKIKRIPLIKNLMKIIISMGKRTNLKCPAVVMRKRKQKREGRGSVKRRRKS
jgi:hypothetical protein